MRGRILEKHHDLIHFVWRKSLPVSVAKQQRVICLELVLNLAKWILRGIKTKSIEYGSCSSL